MKRRPGGESVAVWNRLIGLLILALLTLANGALAQQVLPDLDRDQPVALVADEIDYDTTTERVIARGNVEVYYGDRTLTADVITYDNRTGRIGAEGQIVLRDESGATVFADIADLDQELTDGLVQGAKLVLDEHVRLSAVEGRREDGRFNVLSKAVYSACEVCEENPTPLWRIRARRVIYDEEARIVHYENAWFDVFGIPVFWTPYFQHPDPTLGRASGFLVPDLSQSTNYGYGLKLPYYIVLDDQSDLTITPFVTTDEGVIGIGEYRRAFSNGSLSLIGSLTQTDFTGEPALQGHIDTDALFRTEGDIRYGWDISFASDDAYLRVFDFSDEDRLTSELFVNKYRESGFFDLAAVRFQSLRDGEPAGQIPLVVPDFDARHELDSKVFGGTLGFTASSQGLLRNNGTDSARLSTGIDWEREEILAIGLAVKGFAEMRGDLFLIGDDPTIDDTTSLRLAPLAGVEARYPLIYSEGGVTQIVEPIAQAIVAPFGGNGDDVPNEDSLATEFDELNLFDRNHFSGLDAFEEGPRLNLGLRYDVSTDFGLSGDATIGRVLRLQEVNAFSPGSGLADEQSDWVGAWSVAYDPYVTVRQRLRFDDGGRVNRNELLGDISVGPVSLAANYIFLNADPTIGAPADREEVSGQMQLRFTDEWSASGYLQRDLEIDEFVEVGGTLAFANECCAIEGFLRRRFTSSSDAPASTAVGLRVRLFTLGDGRTERDR